MTIRYPRLSDCVGKGDTKMTRYDEATNGIEAVRERLRSIATLAIQSQNEDACGDKIHELLGYIERDLQFAKTIAENLNSDRVYLAEEIALTGNLSYCS